MPLAPELLDWLLDADPALRWQVERDLAGAPEDVWRATRTSVATEGFGARPASATGASTRSSFHSTLSSLKSLLYYEAATGGSDELRAARRAGEEYLLERRLLRRLSTGELVGPWTTWFGYPFRHAFSALNALDYFRAAALHDGVGPDPRLADAVEVVRAARRQDGTWLQEGRLPGRVWFEVDVPTGEPSKWLTFYGVRVLDWWDAANAA